jgi:hypothetical protein
MEARELPAISARAQASLILMQRLLFIVHHSRARGMFDVDDVE